jgi:hypothetical protein
VERALSGLALWTLSYPIVLVLAVLAASALALWALAALARWSVEAVDRLLEAQRRTWPRYYVLDREVYVVEVDGATRWVGWTKDPEFSRWLHGRPV